MMSDNSVCINTIRNITVIPDVPAPDSQMLIILYDYVMLMLLHCNVMLKM